MRCLYLCVFLLFNYLVNAQFFIKGKITDENDLPLKSVHVHIGNKITTTNTEGNFLIENLSTGEYKLYISYIGYETISENITITENTFYNKQLNLEIISLEATTVYEIGNRYSNVENEQKLSLEAIEKYSGVTLGDALKEIPGVSTLKTGTSVVKPVINGLHSFRVPIINDNVKLEDQQWGVEHAPNFDINSANAISVLRGASTLQYGGDAIGGIVIIEPISLRKDTLVGKTIITGATNGRGGSISSSITKGVQKGWGWNLVTGAKHFGDRETPNYILSNTGNREQSFSSNAKLVQENYTLIGSYSFFNAKIGILRASHIGNVTDLYNAINYQEPYYVAPFSYDIDRPRQEVQHHLAKVNFKKMIHENSNYEIQYAFQFNNRKEFDIRRNSNDVRPALDLDLFSHTITTRHFVKVNQWKFNQGISLGYQNNKSNPNTGVRPLIPDFEKFDFGVYQTTDIKIDNSFRIEGGLRYDFSKINASKFYLKSRWNERDYDQEFSGFIVENFGNQWLTKPSFTFNNLSASLGFYKRFHHEINWFFNIGLATRNPNVSELFSDGLHHSTGQIELGDLRLNQEKALKINSSIKKEWKKITFEANPFINRIVDFIYLQPVGFETTIRGAFPVWEYKQTDALLMGIDVNTNWTINNNINYKGSFSYLKGRNLISNDYLIDMPPFNTTHTVQYKNNSWKNLKIELQSETVLRQTSYPNFNFETNIVVNGNITPTLIDISSPPNTYSLLHLFAECQLITFKKSTITTAFSIQNLLNTNYRDYLNRQRYYANELGRNIQIQLKFNY